MVFGYEKTQWAVKMVAMGEGEAGKKAAEKQRAGKAVGKQEVGKAVREQEEGKAGGEGADQAAAIEVIEGARKT